MGKLIIISGEKGGVGKSTVCHGIIDILSNSIDNADTKAKDDGEKLVILETDATNMDIYKTYNKSALGCEIIDIRGENEEVEFLNFIEDNKDNTVVVNMCAGAGIHKYGNSLIELCSELNISITIMWVINTDRDPVELLSQYISQTDDVKSKYRIFAVKNLYFGKPEMFKIYDNSKTSKKADGTVLFPKLSAVVTPHINNNRYSLHDAEAKADRISTRQLIHTYRKEIRTALSGVIEWTK